MYVCPPIKKYVHEKQSSWFNPWEKKHRWAEKLMKRDGEERLNWPLPVLSFLSHWWEADKQSCEYSKKEKERQRVNCYWHVRDRRQREVDNFILGSEQKGSEKRTKSWLMTCFCYSRVNSGRLPAVAWKEKWQQSEQLVACFIMWPPCPPPGYRH